MMNIQSNDTLSDTKAIIAKVLNIENSAAWEIVSSDPEHNLYMVHHRPEANLTDYGQIRGIVVDTRSESIVCQSYGHMPTVVSNEIGPLGATMIDDNGTSHIITDPTFKIGYEGTMINVFKHDGIVYYATRKRLDSSKSRWGSSNTFLNLYQSLNGPTDEDLFDPFSDYSPYCHSFIIVHPDLLVASKDDVGDGFLVYLGYKQVFDTDYRMCPYKQVNEKGDLYISQEEFDNDKRVNAGWIDSTLHLPNIVGKTIFPKDLTLEEANKHLMFGFYDPSDMMSDKRMLPGEFVIVQMKNVTLRVESIAYHWRSTMRDNNPNLRHRFFQLTNDCRIAIDGAATNDKYPLFTPYDTNSIKQQLIEDGPYVVWPQDFLPTMNDRESILYNIWLSFLNAVPLHHQQEVSSYLEYFYTKRYELIGWLLSLESTGVLDPVLFSYRTIDLISAARKFAKSNKNKQIKDGKKLSVKEITKNNIKNFVMKEEGSSLYRLIREMDFYKQNQNSLLNAKSV